MKMNKSALYAFGALLAISAAACSDDDQEPAQSLQATSFVGEWFTLDEDGNPSVLSLQNNHTASFTLYSDDLGRKSEQANGIWILANGKYLRYDLTWPNYDGMSDVFSVRKIDGNSMKLVDQATNTPYSFCRITGTQTLYAGETIDGLDANGDAVIEFSNPAMVAEGADGSYTAEVPGTLFATVRKDGVETARRIVIKSVSSMFVSQLGQNINLVKEMLGEPNVEQLYGENMACVWKYPGATIRAIQYHYDLITGQITRVLTAYTDEAGYEAEAQYIASWQPYHDGDTYFPTADLSESPYIIDLMGTSLMIDYVDVPYLLANGHYAPSKP